MLLTRVAINGQVIDSQMLGGARSTFWSVSLPTPIAPKDSGTLEIDWHFQVPVTSMRMGRWGDTLFQVAQWYPRVKVYDDLNGWDPEPYLSGAEFYNNFGRTNQKLDDQSQCDSRKHMVVTMTSIRRGGGSLCRVMLGTLIAVYAGAARAQQPVATPAATPRVPHHRPAAIAIQGATVIDVAAGGRLLDQTIILVGNHIQTIGPAAKVRVPRGARLVDARGRYLIPGLWDMHTHLGALAPQAEQGAIARTTYLLLLANGVTGIRDAGSPIPLDSTLAWRRAIVAGEQVGPPRQLLPGRLLEGGNVGNPTWTHMVSIATMADFRRAVDSLLAAGADYIKIHDFRSPLRDSAIAELRQRRVLFGGHMGAGDSGARFADHDLYHSGDGLTTCYGTTAALQRCRSLAERMRRNDMWLVQGPCSDNGANLALARAWGRLSRAQQERQQERQQRRFASGWCGRLEAESDADWDAARDSLSKSPDYTYSIMEQSGVPLLLGTDLMHGDEWTSGAIILDAVTGLVRRGMSPLAALQAVTLNPAKALHATDSLGTVAPGKLADLLLLDGDPLADIRNVTKIRSVVANGRYFDRATLDSLLVGIDYNLVSHSPGNDGCC